MARLLALCGSSRSDSLNRRVVQQLAHLAAEKGATVNELDLADLAIPIYHADEEEGAGTPAGATALRDAMLNCDGLIIGCPEYNGFMTPLLLNALDWASRANGKPDLAAFANKIVLISSASPGGFGGMRAAGHLRTMLGGIGCIILPQSFAVPGALNAFDADGQFANENLGHRASQVVDNLIDVVNRFK